MSAHKKELLLYFSYPSFLSYTTQHTKTNLVLLSALGNARVVENREQARRIQLLREATGPAVKPKKGTRSSFTQMWLFIKHSPYWSLSIEFSNMETKIQ